MDNPLRQLIWLWVVLGIIFSSLVISIIFLLINKCISKRAAEQYITNSSSIHHSTPEFYAQSRKYHPKDLEDDLPPLPPRTQFNNEAQSYENLAELPDYVKIDEDEALPPPYTYTHTDTVTCQEASPDRDSISTYDDIGQDGSQSEEDYDDVE